MIRFLEWDTNFFGVKCGKAIFDKPLTDEQWAEFLEEQKEYDFVSIVNTNCNVENAVKIARDTKAFLVDTNVQMARPAKDVPMPEDVVIEEALPYNEKFASLADFEHSKFYHDKNLRDRGGEKVYENWIKNSFDKEGKFFAYVPDLGYCIFSFEGETTCVMELMRISDESRGKGIGKKIAAAIEHYAYSRGCTTIALGTQVTNMGAVNFHIACGQRFLRADSTYHLWNI